MRTIDKASVAGALLYAASAFVAGTVVSALAIGGLSLVRLSLLGFSVSATCFGIWVCLGTVVGHRS